MAVDLDPVRRMVGGDHALASVCVVRADGTPHVSLVNAGVLDHPRTGTPVAAYVTYGAVKLRTLRARPATSVMWRVGWRWAAVDGASELVGPEDTDPESLRLLLRAVFRCAGGTHDDWDTYDRASCARRAASPCSSLRVALTATRNRRCRRRPESHFPGARRPESGFPVTLERDQSRRAKAERRRP